MYVPLLKRKKSTDKTVPNPESTQLIFSFNYLWMRNPMTSVQLSIVSPYGQNVPGYQHMAEDKNTKFVVIPDPTA